MKSIIINLLNVVSFEKDPKPPCYSTTVASKFLDHLATSWNLKTENLLYKSKYVIVLCCTHVGMSETRTLLLQSSCTSTSGFYLLTGRMTGWIGWTMLKSLGFDCFVPLNFSFTFFKIRYILPASSGMSYTHAFGSLKTNICKIYAADLSFIFARGP